MHCTTDFNVVFFQYIKKQCFLSDTVFCCVSLKKNFLIELNRNFSTGLLARFAILRNYFPLSMQKSHSNSGLSLPLLTTIIEGNFPSPINNESPAFTGLSRLLAQILYRNSVIIGNRLDGRHFRVLFGIISRNDIKGIAQTAKELWEAGRIAKILAYKHPDDAFDGIATPR